MRIRKHAKISPLLYASSSLKPGTVIQTHVCQLNQSPWDVMTFPPPDPSTLPPPPAFLVDKDHSYFPNGFFSDHIAADQRPGPKVKLDDIAAGGKFEQKESLRSKKEEEDEVFDCKIDGKGWQRRKKVKNEQPFCQRHLAPQPSASVKKSESGRRARPKKPASSSNPYEFYYYSGFGPRWGKKRGAAAAATVAAMKEEPYTSHDSSSENTSSRNNNSSIIEVDAAEGPNTPEPSVKSSPFTSQFHKQVLDYVEDDDEDDYDNYSKLDDDENGEMGRKRARKPIKARSLKSLM
ncbi:uncharacterized protein LOC113763496 [Coffea eugenioides]|uniref:uncharacterized protein LOC113763496 n=1 Tax=Coffea eugenioides TaxID=49369 RepID=UPI000F61153A|nr:uncharacterized protein LOC113763496 [Coffea eugenioides]